MARLCFVTLFLAAVLLGTPSARSEGAPAVQSDHFDREVDLMHSAISAKIAVSYNQRTRTAIPAYHCRHAAEGCERRLREFANYLVEAGFRHGVDPWLMAAMAFQESGFNPFATGSVGEMGILQIHPKSPRARHVRFIHDDRYRQRCRKQPGACQQEVVDHAAQVLARSLEQCDGDLKAALGAYNTGRCSGNHEYSERILNVRDSLRRSVGLDPAKLARNAS